ncbi:MAG: hypothetical protein WB774_03885, partial [Xanthobacteraceae bacterium]
FQKGFETLSEGMDFGHCRADICHEALILRCNNICCNATWWLATKEARARRLSCFDMKGDPRSATTRRAGYPARTSAALCCGKRLTAAARQRALALSR